MSNQPSAISRQQSAVSSPRASGDAKRGEAGRRGQSLVELLMAIGLAAILLPAVLVGLVSSRNGKVQQYNRQDASNVLKQTVDSLRTIRETAGWQTFAADGTFHVVSGVSSWSLAAGSYTDSNGFTTQVAISDAYRNQATQNIVATGTPGSVLDPSTKQIVTTVSWAQPTASSVQSTMYMTRYLDNLSYIDTTYADFNAGTSTGTAVEYTSGSPTDGDIRLSTSGGHGADWCAPNLTGNTDNLPHQGITTAIWAVAGGTVGSVNHAYTTSGGNASGDSMDGVSITDPQDNSKPLPTNVIPVYNNQKTYGIYIDSLNQYAYLTSDHPGISVDIVQVTTTPFSQTGTYNAGVKGYSVFVAYNNSLGYDVGYVTTSNKLFSFNLSSKTGVRANLGNANLAGTGVKVLVVGNYAYVAVGNSSEQLDIFNVSNPGSPAKVSSINVGNGEPATDVFVNSTGTRAYLVTSQSNSSENDFFIIDTSNKITTLPSPIGHYNTTPMSPNGVTIVSPNKAIVVGSGSSKQYQVLDIGTESNPILCKPTAYLSFPQSPLTQATTINAISAISEADNDSYAYILTNDPNNEFLIIEGGGGLGSGPYTASGTFVAKSGPPSIPSIPTAFNSFQATVNKPSSSTDVQLQIAAANAVSGSCSGATYNYIGPDGTSGSRFLTGAASGPTSFSFALPLNFNTGQCFRYKAYLSTTDQTSTPYLYDISINYSP